MAIINPATNCSVDVISLGLILTYVLGLGIHISPATLGLTWVLLSILHGRVFHFPALVKEVQGSPASTPSSCHVLLHQPQAHAMFSCINPKLMPCSLASTPSSCHVLLHRPQARAYCFFSFIVHHHHKHP